MRRGVIPLAALALACSSSAPNTFQTSTSAEPRPRRPPGIALDPPAALPGARRSAETHHVVLSLSTPADVEQARTLVRRFFDAVADESMAELTPVLEERGRLWGASSNRRESLQSAWARRLNQLDYGALAGHVVYRDSEFELYRAEEAARLVESRALPLSPREDELLVRVSILSPAPGGTRLFGDDIVFLLRPAPGGGYRVGEMYEDFRIP